MCQSTNQTWYQNKSQNIVSIRMFAFARLVYQYMCPAFFQIASQGGFLCMCRPRTSSMSQDVEAARSSRACCQGSPTLKGFGTQRWHHSYTRLWLPKHKHCQYLGPFCSCAKSVQSWSLVSNQEGPCMWTLLWSFRVLVSRTCRKNCLCNEEWPWCASIIRSQKHPLCGQIC